MRMKETKEGVAAWTAMMQLYHSHGHFQEVIKMFKKMKEEGEEGLKPNEHMYSTIIRSFAEVGYYKDAINIHAQLKVLILQF